MSLSSNQLDAFFAVARTGNFTAAAKTLGITQSALSQRVKNLEDDLATALLVREPSGIILTARGEELLQYCKVRESLESEVLHRMKSPPGQSSLSGVIRVAGFSTIMRSVVVPALAPFLKLNPKVQFDFMTREIKDLPRLLKNGEADLILLDRVVEKDGIESLPLGMERNVLIEPKSGSVCSDVYLDHDSDDEITSRFFALAPNRSRRAKLRRSFLDEIYGIIDGVAAGLGRAVVPSHLIHADPRVQRVDGWKPLLTPVYMQYYRQPYYPRLFQSVLQQMEQEIPRRLKVD